MGQRCFEGGQRGWGEIHAHRLAHGANAQVSQRASPEPGNPPKAQEEATAAKKAQHAAEAAQRRDAEAAAEAKRQVAPLLFRYKIGLEVLFGSFAVV